MHQIVQFQSQICKSSLVWEGGGGHPPPSPSPRSGASRPRLLPHTILDNLAPPPPWKKFLRIRPCSGSSKTALISDIQFLDTIH